VREELTPRAQAEQVVDWLLSSQYIDTKMFERLLELRPRSRAEIERVRQMFVDLSAQRD
jgi:DNA-directed RNA polymerase subunit F